MSKSKGILIGAVLVLIVLYAGVKVWSSRIAEERLAEVVKTISPVIDLKYDDVSLDVLGMNLHIKNALISSRGQSEEMKIREIVIYDFDDKSKIPSHLHLACNDIEIDLARMGRDPGILQEFGYEDNILANLRINYYYNKENKELKVNDFTLSVDDMGDLNFTLRIGNIALTPEGLSELLFKFPELTLIGTQTIYKDDSLIDRIIKAEAGHKNLDIKEYKTEIMEIIDEEIEKVKDKDVIKMMKEFKKFIKTPRKLSISLSPDKPVPFSQISGVKDAEELIKLLGIEIYSQGF